MGDDWQKKLREGIKPQQERMIAEQQKQLEPAWKEALGHLKDRNDPTLIAALLWRVTPEGDGFTKIPSLSSINWLDI